MHRNTKGESPCVANVKNCVRKTLECTQFTNELRRATRSTLQRVHKCIEFGGGIFENLLWDVPDVDEPGFCPLQIISNTMVSTSMHAMLVVMLFNT